MRGRRRAAVHGRTDSLDYSNAPGPDRPPTAYCCPVQTTRPARPAGARHLAAAVPAALLAGVYVVAVGTAFGRRVDAEVVQAFPDGGSLEALAEAAMQPVNVASAALVALAVTTLA